MNASGTLGLHARSCDDHSGLEGLNREVQATMGNKTGATRGSIADWAAIAVALIAFGLSVCQFRLMEEHNKLSVKPILSFNLTYQGISLRNKGVGPAIIKRVSYGKDSRYWAAGQSLGEIVDDLIKARIAAPVQIESRGFEGEEAIREGEAESLVIISDDHLEVSPAERVIIRRGIIEVLRKELYLKVDYCSIYNEHCEELILH